MGGWVDEWVEGWMDESMGGWMDDGRWVCGWLAGWLEGWVDGCTDIRIDGGWVDGLISKQTQIHVHRVLYNAYTHSERRDRKT